MKKLGIISSWNTQKYCGVIICRDANPIERFFLFGSRVIAGPEPYQGALVMFEPDARPVLPGKLPVAIRVEVLETEGGAQ